MTKKYKSDLFGAIHESAEDLYRAGLIDAKTMREFDASCLSTVEPMSPKQIAALRKKNGLSQAVFASYLNVTTGLISQWERGEKKPRGASLKLLTLVRKKGLEAIA
jgi:putative transcriptional regulator